MVGKVILSTLTIDIEIYETSRATYTAGNGLTSQELPFPQIHVCGPTAPNA